MKLKLIVIGPQGSGKTQISNYLTGHSEALITDRYEATAGVRILESELTNVHIELWDASGDHKYHACWKAIMTEADGVILVYNPDAPGQDTQLNDWFDFFVKKNGLRDDQCLIFAHRVNPTNERFRPPQLFSKVAATVTGPNNLADMKGMYENFVKELSSLRSRK